MLRKITGKQSHILRIRDVQKCTIAWGFETKENYNEDNNFAIVKTSMSSPRSRRPISKNSSGGKLFGLKLNGVWRHFVAMVTQILLKCILFETFIFL